MGAVETQMIDCAYAEIGKYLGLPTQAYIALSDAKQLDAQAGLETSMGATLAVRTRPGRADGFHGKASLGAAGAFATLEGPIGKRVSWIASARKSYLDYLLEGVDDDPRLALGYHDRVVVSPHIGDLETPEAVDGMLQVAHCLPEFLRRKPVIVAVDLNPDMHSKSPSNRVIPRKK